MITRHIWHLDWSVMNLMLENNSFSRMGSLCLITWRITRIWSKIKTSNVADWAPISAAKLGSEEKLKRKNRNPLLKAYALWTLRSLLSSSKTPLPTKRRKNFQKESKWSSILKRWKDPTHTYRWKTLAESKTNISMTTTSKFKLMNFGKNRSKSTALFDQREKVPKKFNLVKELLEKKRKQSTKTLIYSNKDIRNYY